MIDLMVVYFVVQKADLMANLMIGLMVGQLVDYLVVQKADLVVDDWWCTKHKNETERDQLELNGIYPNMTPTIVLTTYYKLFID